MKRNDDCSEFGLLGGIAHRGCYAGNGEIHGELSRAKKMYISMRKPSHFIQLNVKI